MQVPRGEERQKLVPVGLVLHLPSLKAVLGTERLYSCSTKLISDYEVFDHG